MLLKILLQGPACRQSDLASSAAVAGPSNLTSAEMSHTMFGCMSSARSHVTTAAAATAAARPAAADGKTGIRSRTLITHSYINMNLEHRPQKLSRMICLPATYLGTDLYSTAKTPSPPQPLAAPVKLASWPPPPLLPCFRPPPIKTDE